MNRHARRAAASHQSAPKANQTADRIHLLTTNRREILMAAEKASGSVVVVADSRDHIARKWILAAGVAETAIKAHEAAIFGRAIPTFVLAMTRPFAIAVTAEHAPASSEALRALPADITPILVIASGGTTMSSVQALEAA